MKIGILKEREKSEKRVAATPDIVKLFIKAGFDLVIEKEAGKLAGFKDSEYMEAGAKLSSVPLEIVSDADLILKVQPTPVDDKINELEFAKEKAIIIGQLAPFENKELIKRYKYKNLTTFAMEFVPRITRAQNMDALSSQSNLAGYRAVIEGVYHLSKATPMMMTAAGTVHPAHVLILGAGVAGLQALATAKRLGAVVSVFDVRAAAKEQVESLGGKFIAVGESSENETTGGYAKEVSSDYKLKQQLLISEAIQKSDLVITTALIPGKPAPILVTKAMVESMKPGSVIVDLATSKGGNCEYSQKDKTTHHSGVTIIGNSNIVSEVAYDASRLYAKNLYNFVMHLIDGKTKQLNDFSDEIMQNMLLTHNGEIVNEKIR